MKLIRTAQRALQDVWRCERGAEMIEFALLSPILFSFILGSLEVSAALYAKVDAEGALREASRWGITGQMPPVKPDGTQATREQQIRAIITCHINGRVDMTKAKVTLLEYPSFNDVGQPEPYNDANANKKYDAGETYTDLNGNKQWDADRGRVGAGAAQSVVLYRIDYEWPLLTGIIAPVFGKQGKMDMSSSIIARNEPFQATAPGTSNPCNV